MKWLLAYFICGLPLTVVGATYEERAIASVLMGEAWGEGTPGMTAVAEVIHQRTVDKKQTPLQVISVRQGKYHAFSCLNGTTVDHLIAKYTSQPEFEKALHIAQIACEVPSGLPGISNSADHFTRVDERPYWARGRKPVAIIGQHAFYKLKRY
jgi:spore germination cell wall hydrolase CwlJ-like protein